MTCTWNSLCEKREFLERLRARAGFPSLLSFAKPFEFDTAEDRWTKLTQLEAIVEFYVNYRPISPTGGDNWGDPWADKATPLVPGDDGYVTVNLGPIKGTSAKVGQNAVIQLDGKPDLSVVVPNPPDNQNPEQPDGPAADPKRLTYLYDTIELSNDKKRKSKLYRIMEIMDEKAGTIRLDAAPDLGNRPSPWEIYRRPTLVIIDPLGPRSIVNPTAAIYSGTAAKVVDGEPGIPEDWSVLQLDVAANLPIQRVNSRFDTIYLSGDDIDAHKPARSYRIMRLVNATDRKIAVAGKPKLPASGSAWHIPAGVSGTNKNLSYNIVPGSAPPPARSKRGWDHYDGALFIVHRGQVVSRFRWSTYTSRDSGSWRDGWPRSLSSIRGNGRFFYSSIRAGGHPFQNFCFRVIDADPNRLMRPHFPRDLADSTQRARYYFGTRIGNTDDIDERVTRDADGKDFIRIHMGNTANTNWNASGGCLVSPEFVEFRTQLIRLYKDEYTAFHRLATNAMDWDSKLETLLTSATTSQASQTLWNQGEVVFPAAAWQDKLLGTLWVVRPDELPQVG
jgi:hypothetical protein